MGTKRDWQSPRRGSPLIANIYLDVFDQFMRSRGHRIVRYADDILVLTRSKRAAENALKQSTQYLEQELKLTVNKEKTHVTHSSKGVKFLGVLIHTGFTRIQPEKVSGFKEKARKITRRNSPVNLGKVIADLNPVIRGFANYFRIANCKNVFQQLMPWIRRRLRAKQLKLWKKSKRLHRRLRQLGYTGEFKAIKMASWRNSASPLASYALPNKYFEEIGLYNIVRVQTGISVQVG